MLFFCEVHDFFVFGSGSEFFEGDGGSLDKGYSLGFKLLILLLNIGDHVFNSGHFEVKLIKSISEFEDHLLALLFGYSQVINNSIEAADLLYLFCDLSLLFFNSFFVLISEKN